MQFRRLVVATLFVAAGCARSEPDDAAPESTPAIATDQSAPDDAESTNLPPDPDAAATTTGGSAAPVEIAPCSGAVDRVDTVAYRAIDGVDADLLSLDVHSPAVSDGCPAIVWVHGGGWSVGDKAAEAVGVKAAHFVDAGYVFVSVNYRLVADDNGVRWPDFGSDVAAATAWVIEHADELGVDPDRVGLLGHSAGAHLVSIVGTNPDLLDEFGFARSDVRCVGSLDTETYDLDAANQVSRPIVQAAFGDDLNVLKAGSPIDQVDEHVDDGPVPTFLIVTRGRPARVASSEAFLDALGRAGADVSLVNMDPYDHADINVRLGEPGEDFLTEPVTGFFDECLA